MPNLYAEAAHREWNQARRKALWLQLRSGLSSKKIALVDFDQLARQFDLGNVVYQGTQKIPVAKIMGSVGRYHDFIQTFLPATENIRQRWEKIAIFYLDPYSRGLPPIEVYQVGDGYFVSDGNHRVSVARQLGLKEIEAHVWQYLQPVAGLAPGVDIDTLLIEAERCEFLTKTHLDELRPGHNICLTVPGGYPQMLNQIAHYQRVLSVIDETEITYEQAVTAWHDMLYKSTVLLIENAGILKIFPRRTAADFFIWAGQHHRQLEEQYGQPVLMADAVQDIRKQKRFPALVRFWHSFWSWVKSTSFKRFR